MRIATQHAQLNMSGGCQNRWRGAFVECAIMLNMMRQIAHMLSIQTHDKYINVRLSQIKSNKYINMSDTLPATNLSRSPFIKCQYLSA